MRTRVRGKLLGLALAALGLAGGAQAFTVDDFVVSDEKGLSPVAYFAFIPITSNGDQTGIDLGLAVSVGAVDGFSGMFFEFVNQSTAPNDGSSITEIYFETADLEGTPHLLLASPTSTSVNYTIGVGGGGGIGFTINSELTGTADSPRPSNGINPGESLLIGFTIPGVVGDPDYVQVADDLLAGLTGGDWSIGLHIQSTGLDREESEKYVARFLPNGPQDPNDPIPEPATLILLGMGSCFLATRMRRHC